MFCLLKLKCLFSLCYLFPSTRLLFFVFPVLPHFFLSPCAFPWVRCCRTKFSCFGCVPRVKWAYEVTCEFEHEVLCLGSVPRARLRETELGLPQSRITRGSCFPSAHFTRCLSRFFFFSPCGFPELQVFAHHGRPAPRFQVTLCFGEEFPDPQRQRKLITAHVSSQLHHCRVTPRGAVPFREVAGEEQTSAHLGK